MKTELFKPQIRLTFQGNIPVEDVIEAEEHYGVLKEMMKNFHPKMTFNGQIMKILEPCCLERKGEKDVDKTDGLAK